MKRVLQHNLITVSVFGMIAVQLIAGVLIFGLLNSNHQRINDIQASRVESCQRTYEGIRQVFKPFFSPHPTPKQKADLDKFNRTINRYKAGCVRQTKP